MPIPKYILYKVAREIFSRCGLTKKRPVVISFTGGMGAQIISAAIYMDLECQGYDVHADFRYFEQKQKVYHEYSVWDWQLDCYGLTMKDFKRYEINNFKLITSTYIKDGDQKTQLALLAMDKKNIVDRFFKYTEKFKSEIQILLDGSKELSEPYLCVHLRRGDYLKVASHVVSEEHFLEVICRMKNILKAIVIISDSPASENFKETLKRDFKSTMFYDSGNLDFAISHYLMTKSSILICSNSQFSWTAGKLASGLVLIPKKWFGEMEKSLESLILEKSKFSIM